MTEPMTWGEKLEAIIAKAGTVRELARRMTALNDPGAAPFDPGKISRWRNWGLFPSPADQVRLATVAGEPVDEIRRLVWEAEKTQDAARETRRKDRPHGHERVIAKRPLAKVPSRLMRSRRAAVPA